MKNKQTNKENEERYNWESSLFYGSSTYVL